jgi:hypothetical protein
MQSRWPREKVEGEAWGGTKPFDSAVDYLGIPRRARHLKLVHLEEGESGGRETCRLGLANAIALLLPLGTSQG